MCVCMPRPSEGESEEVSGVATAPFLQKRCRNIGVKKTQHYAVSARLPLGKRCEMAPSISFFKTITLEGDVRVLALATHVHTALQTLRIVDDVPMREMDQK